MIRAEAAAVDKMAALDLALDKMASQMRRASDRRRVSRTGRRVPESVAQATGRLAPDAAVEARVDTTVGADGVGGAAAGPFGAVGESPIEVREKVHASAPMTLEDALNQMELVGHDFFLFHDSDTDRPSVVYRRRGWSYGVLHLETSVASDLEAATG